MEIPYGYKPILENNGQSRFLYVKYFQMKTCLQIKYPEVIFHLIYYILCDLILDGSIPFRLYHYELHIFEAYIM